jgi:hypothetical protein
MKMNFVPDQQSQKIVPYFEDARKEDGWQGHTTTKSIERLKAEIVEAVTRLGGFVAGFQRGKFVVDNRERDGFQVFYSLGGAPSRVDIAALPVKDKWNIKKKEQSLRMALFMLREGFDGMWLMQQLIPGYAPLVMFMLDRQGKTISQLWAEQPMIGKLLPPPESEFTEAEVIE